MGKIEASVRHELRAASDEIIKDAVKYADPMVLRGLLYQLTGDPEVAATTLKMERTGFYDRAVPATAAEVALLQCKAAEFLEGYRDAGAGAWNTSRLTRGRVHSSGGLGRTRPRRTATGTRPSTTSASRARADGAKTDGACPGTGARED